MSSDSVWKWPRVLKISTAETPGFFFFFATELISSSRFYITC
jgi:hypothetical protein